MKKILLLILFLILPLGLFSCKESSELPDDNDPIINPVPENPVEEPKDEEPTPTELQLIQANLILDRMTVEEKIGQMFMVGFNGTSMPASLSSTIENKKIGNFIYFGPNVTDDSKVIDLSTVIQNKVMDTVGIPAFISMDQEGGMVVRFANSATHFIGAMGLTATNDSNNAYNVGKLSGKELRHFGVNHNLAPVLDVNNNYQNPVIGVRSFSDNQDVVSEYGLEMIKGLNESRVMTAVKHFPGHGDTTVDSHYGLPRINHDLTRLYEVELSPFIDAISSGVDSIMTAHIIFSSIDEEYPATLSYKVINNLLREELKYDGIVMTDSMNMNAISSFYGVKDAAILSINAGVDMLLYGESTTLSMEAYDGVLEAVNKGEISIDEINDSVIRILLKKIKYNLIEDYLPKNNLTANDFNNHKAYNKNLVNKSIAISKGSIDVFNKSKSTLFISTVSSRYPLLPGLSVNSNNNSFAYVANSHFSNLGVSTGYEVITTNVSSSKINEIVSNSNNYDKVIIALENITSSQINLINQLLINHDDLLLVSLRNPYDILYVPNVRNHVCTFGYYPASVNAILSLIKNEFEATGVMPVDLNK